MNTLDKLLAWAHTYKMTPEEEIKQKASFVDDVFSLGGSQNIDRDDLVQIVWALTCEKRKREKKSWKVKNLFLRFLYKCYSCGHNQEALVNLVHKGKYHWPQETPLFQTYTCTVCQEEIITSCYDNYGIYWRKSFLEQCFLETPFGEGRG